MPQRGQLIPLKTLGADGKPLWAYRYRLGGRGTKRVQHGGFVSADDARDSLRRALDRARRETGSPARSLTLAELVDEYLDQHEVQPTTAAKLRWLLAKAVAAFGETPLAELRSQDIAAWRMTIRPGYRFEATQALRQALARAVEWGLLDSNPAKTGVHNPQRRPHEMRPFEHWNDIDAVATRRATRHGSRRPRGRRADDGPAPLGRGSLGYEHEAEGGGDGGARRQRSRTHERRRIATTSRLRRHRPRESASRIHLPVHLRATVPASYSSLPQSCSCSTSSCLPPPRPGPPASGLGCPASSIGRSRKGGPARSGGPPFLESPGVERDPGRGRGGGVVISKDLHQETTR